MPITRVLVVADTHLPAKRADEIVERLASHLETADLILHAGDVTDAGVLEQLGRFAPVHAVLGNNDDGLELPETLELEIAGVAVAMIHDSGAAKGRGNRLARRFPAADVVVFGHSHLPWNETHDVDGRPQVHLNPGSPTQRRRAPTRTVGWLEIADGAPRASIVDV